MEVVSTVGEAFIEVTAPADAAMLVEEPSQREKEACSSMQR